MNKRVNLLLGGIFSLVIYSLAAFFYIVTMVNAISGDVVVQFIFISGTLLPAGIFGLMRKHEKAYDVLSFLGWANILSFSTYGLISLSRFFKPYTADKLLIPLFALIILCSIFIFVLFAIRSCRINDKVNVLLVLSYIGCFLFVGYVLFVGVNDTIRVIRNLIIDSEHYYFHWTIASWFISYVLIIVSTIFAVMDKQKALWATILILASAILYLPGGIYYNYLPYILGLIESILCIISAIFAFVARPFVLKEETAIDNSNSKTNVYDVEDSKEETSNSNTYVYDLEKEESDSLALEAEDTIDIDVEAKLEKLKSLYEKGLIREEEYKSSVNEILSNI